MVKRSVIVATGTAFMLCTAAHAQDYREGPPSDPPTPSTQRDMSIERPVGGTSGAATSGMVSRATPSERERDDIQRGIRDETFPNQSVRVPWTPNEAGFIQE